MANKVRLRLLTPTKKLFDDDVDMVIMRSLEGDLGILYGHEPLTTILGYGIIKIYDESEERIFSVLGGFAEVNQDGITVLSDAAEDPSEIDKARVEEARARAERVLKEQADQVDIRRAELALRRALVRMEASTYPLVGNKKHT